VGKGKGKERSIEKRGRIEEGEKREALKREVGKRKGRRGKH
jgi:hypothetical protein